MPGHLPYKYKYDFEVGDLIYGTSIVMFIIKVRVKDGDGNHFYDVNTGKGPSLYLRKDLCKLIEYKGFKIQKRAHLYDSSHLST